MEKNGSGNQVETLMKALYWDYVFEDSDANNEINKP